MALKLCEGTSSLDADALQARLAAVSCGDNIDVSPDALTSRCPNAPLCFLPAVASDASPPVPLTEGTQELDADAPKAQSGAVSCGVGDECPIDASSDRFH